MPLYWWEDLGHAAVYFIRIYNQHIQVAGSTFLCESSGASFRHSPPHPHSNPHPIIYHLLVFHLNYFSPTALLQSLIASNVASSLLVTSLMKPLMPRPWQLCGKEVLAVVAQICKQAAWLFQSCLQDKIPAPLPRLSQKREKGAVSLEPRVEPGPYECLQTLQQCQFPGVPTAGFSWTSHCAEVIESSLCHSSCHLQNRSVSRRFSLRQKEESVLGL